MKLQKFKERNKKQKSIIIFTIACVLLISGVFLYKSFASFQVIKNQDYINGSIEDPGDIYFAFYKDNKIQKEMPTKEQGYVLDEVNSYCGVTGGSDSNIKVSVSEDEIIHVNGVTSSRTKCNLYFVKGAYILGKGVPIVESDDGLYEVKHNDNDLDEKWKTTEYRYAGKSPNNYIKFNNEDWRIIGLVNVMTDETHVEQRIKIIREESIGSYSWDTTINSQGIYRGENKWNKADLMTLLNDYYYNNKGNQLCWVYVSSMNPQQISCSFDGVNGNIKGLQNVHNMIDENIIWTLGERFATNITAPEAYQKERIVSGEDSKWPNETSKSSFHSIGLMYPSDYGYAYGNRDCAETITLDSTAQSIYQCYKTNWFYVSQMEALRGLLTASIQDEYKVQNLPYGKNLHDGADAYGSSNVYPTLYLKSNIKITNGNGTEGNPWILSEINLS